MPFHYFLGMRLSEHVLLEVLNIGGTWLKRQETEHHPEITETKKNPQDQDQTKKIL